MKITNPYPVAFRVAGRYEVGPNETVDLPPDIARSLIVQGWVKPKPIPEPEQE